MSRWSWLTNAPRSLVASLCSRMRSLRRRVALTWSSHLEEALELMEALDGEEPRRDSCENERIDPTLDRARRSSANDSYTDMKRVVCGRHKERASRRAS